MVHEEDERPPNEKSHAYHLNITYNGCDFCLLTLLQFLPSPNAYLKDGVSKISRLHLPKILFSSLQLKLIGTAQKEAHKNMQNMRNC